jgi:heme-degrading monooxygenase HmoA
MMTIVTHVNLREGAGREWDAAMRTRLSAAPKASGWIGGQLLRPPDKPDTRVIVGTWRTQASWEAWHHDPEFVETRQRLEGLESAPAEHWWHDVVLDVRKASTPSQPTAKSSSTRSQSSGKRAGKGKTKSPRRSGGRRS